MALYVPLSVEWADHPKLIRAGLAGRGLHALVLAIAKRLETDGWVDRLLLHREGADDDLIDKLVALRLLDLDDAHPDAVRPHNWHRHNPSQGAIDATRTAKAEAAKKGNHKRWNHGGSFEACPTCHPKPQVVAPSDTVRDGTDPTGSPETKPEPEPESTPSELATPTPASPAVVLAKHAAVALARQQIQDRVLRGEIGDPQTIAAKKATEDLWPVLGDTLTRLAEQHPDATPERIVELANVDPLTGFAAPGYPSTDVPPDARPRLPEWTPPTVEVADPAVARAALAAARGRTPDPEEAAS